MAHFNSSFLSKYKHPVGQLTSHLNEVSEDGAAFSIVISLEGEKCAELENTFKNLNLSGLENSFE